MRLLTAVVGFLITAVVVYFVVVSMRTVTARLLRPSGNEPAVTDTALRTEIRDLLTRRSEGGRPRA